VLAEHGIDVVMKVSVALLHFTLLFHINTFFVSHVLVFDTTTLNLYSLISLLTTLYLQSDHPVVNSRYLLHEAAQAHYYGLDPALALLSVTYTPATAMGMGHRIGMLKPGA
jgi:hypothetical protein